MLIDFSRCPGLSSFFFSIACLLPQTILFAFQTVFFDILSFFLENIELNITISGSEIFFLLYPLRFIQQA